ncbi:MAG: SPOR domain-containing protein [Sulfuricurvum sp.]
MKKMAFLIIMGMASVLWGSEAVTVQVISAIYEKSITHEFDTRLKKTGLDVHKKIEAGRYVVTLGTYKDEKSAEAALKKARILVAKDAFIRLVNRTHVTAMQPIKPTHTTPSTEHKAVATVEAPKHEAVVKSEEVKPAPTTPVGVALSECDKREMHRSEIGEAIQYYKTSPYHRFEPVKLQ